MDRRSEAGQVVVETAIVALLFVGLFFIAIAIAEHGERARSQHQFNSRSYR